MPSWSARTRRRARLRRKARPNCAATSSGPAACTAFTTWITPIRARPRWQPGRKQGRRTWRRRPRSSSARRRPRADAEDPWVSRLRPRRPSARFAPSHLLEEVIERSAHFELLGAAFHVNDLMAAKVAAHLFDRIDANDGRPMDLPELIGIELVDQFLDRLADQCLERRRLHANIFVLGAEEQDVARGNDAQVGTNARLDPANVLAPPAGAASKALRQLRQQVVHRRGLLLQALT